VTYETLRHFADSYGLAAMAIVWLTLCGWAFRPGSRDRNRAAADIIFRDSDHG
jgi:cytochrome c oxidase cbb3-type subunit IV